MNLLKLALLLVSAVLLAACGDSNPSGQLGPELVSISVSPPSPSLLVGESVTLSATARDRSGNPVARSVQWTSHNPLVATVSSAGLVNALKAGDTEIVASVGAVTGRALLKVSENVSSPAEVASVEIEPKSLTLIEGDRYQLNTIVLDSEGQPLDGLGMIWSVLDPEIIMLSQGSGEVTALKSGMTVVSVKVHGKSASASIRVESFYNFKLVYSQSIAVGLSDLYTVDLNDPAAPEIPIVLPTTANLDPTASPDGSRIAFVALTPTETSIYVADRSGSNAVRLTTNPGTYDQPAWSPDGALIAFRGRLPGMDSDIWVIKPDGSNAVSLTTGHGFTNQSSPAWSPQLGDGSYRIAYSNSENGMGHL